jgi:hypothetical protein
MVATPRKDRYQLMKAGYQLAAACELCGGIENLVIDHIIPLVQGILAHEGDTNTGSHRLREKRVKDAPFELVRGIIAPVFLQWISAHICIPLMSKYGTGRQQ